MQLTETLIINKNDNFYEECERLTFLSKNLYNSGLYYVRQEYFKDKSYKNYYNVNNYFVNSYKIQRNSLKIIFSNRGTISSSM